MSLAAEYSGIGQYRGGVLPGPMTTAQRTAYGATLGAPNAGLWVYDSDLARPLEWSGAAWVDRLDPLRQFTPVKLAAPAGLGFAPAALPVWTAAAEYPWQPSIDPRSLYPTLTGAGTATYYVDPETGNDADAGTSGAPLQTVAAAIGKADVGRILCAPGFYARLNTPGSVGSSALTGPIIVERWDRANEGGKVFFTTGYERSWAANATYSNLWETTASTNNVGSVVWLRITDQSGAYRHFTEAASLLECSTTEFSYFIDGSNGNRLSVNMPGDEEPGVDLVLNQILDSFKWNAANRELYVRGIHFMGGRYAAEVAGNNSKTCTFVDCDFTHADLHGIRVQPPVTVQFFNCRATDNSNDGFHYTSAGVGRMLEANCYAARNGRTGTGTMNGSSMHDDWLGVRIGGLYEDNAGPNVVDVNNSKAWMAGVTARDSDATDTANDVDYSNEAEAWLFACTGGSVRAAGAGVVNLDRCHLPRTEGAGTIQAYTQGVAP